MFHRLQFWRNLATKFSKMASGDKAILCIYENEPKFRFSFRLNIQEPVTIDREFNMSRNVEETMASFTSRLNENVKNKTEKKAKKKKVKLETAENVENSPVDPVQFLNKNGDLIQVDLQQVAKDFLSQNDLKLKVFQAQFQIEVNPPLVKLVKMPESLMANFLVYPYKLELEFASEKDSIFKWFVSDVFSEDHKTKPTESFLGKTSWTFRHEGFFFKLAQEDVNRLVKLAICPKKGDREGILFEVTSASPVSAGPGKCPFEDRHAFTAEKLAKNEFRVVTYNLLADLYADSDHSRTVLFPQCPPYALEIAYRKSLFIKELLGYNADLMTLQEVDNKIYDGDLFPVLSEQGFDGIFDRKGGQVSEGTACFWNLDKFEKLDNFKIHLGTAVEEDIKFADILTVLDTNQQLKENFVKRTTTLQAVVLKSKDQDNQGMILATTHLYFKPDADHIRLLQMALIMRELEELKQKCQAQFSLDFGLLLCGDFNSSPPFGVLEFMREKVIKSNHADWKSAENEHVLGLEIKHDFNMDSACGTPKYTNYTMEFKDCLDYIFYQKDCMQVTSVIPFPSEDDLAVYRGCPNVVFPSDHIACIADLKWNKSS